jgi:hypothetical protein
MLDNRVTTYRRSRFNAIVITTQFEFQIFPFRVPILFLLAVSGGLTVILPKPRHSGKQRDPGEAVSAPFSPWVGAELILCIEMCCGNDDDLRP